MPNPTALRTLVNLLVPLNKKTRKFYNGDQVFTVLTYVIRFQHHYMKKCIVIFELKFVFQKNPYRLKNDALIAKKDVKNFIY